MLKFATKNSYQPGQRFSPGVTRTLLTEQVALLCPQALRSRSVTSSSSLLRPDVPVLLPPVRYAWWLADRSVPFGPSTAGHQDLPDVISANLSLDAWTPTPAVSVVHVPIPSHRTSAFPPLGQGRHTATPCPATSGQGSISGLQSLATLQASRFAGHPGRSHRYDPRSYGSRDVYIRAPQGSLPSLTSDM